MLFDYHTDLAVCLLSAVPVRSLQAIFLKSRFLSFVVISSGLTACVLAETSLLDKNNLGRALFFDTNLSLTRSQSCATCHDPAYAFTDGRENSIAGAVSLGDDKVSVGDRNTPSISYANLVPEFRVNETGEYIGGLFLDGRSASLAEQAKEPFLNPIEMAMPDRASVVARVQENRIYEVSFEALYGPDLFEDTDRAFEAVAESIAAFEQSSDFSTFDSKYDRYLQGDYIMTAQEEIGRLLFFSQLISCHSCHLLDLRETAIGEVFTNHKYSNIGIPVNKLVRERNGVSDVDVGLLGNPKVNDLKEAGKFRVPSLRNVAVTGPYMHNGVFAELETAIIFYDKYLMNTKESNTNPESQLPWGEPEVAENIDLDLLKQGQPITVERASALAAFLRTLTDRRYEHLLDD